MDNKELARLNGILADNLGRNCHGEPLYKWIFSNDLTFPYLNKELWVPVNGIMRKECRYSWERQMPNRECWVLAKWLAPPNYASWLDQFGSETAYPQNGLYYATDILLKPEFEPNETITYDCIGKAKQLRDLTAAEIMEAQQAAIRRDDDDYERIVGDWAADRVTTFGQVPGKCGLTSFPTPQRRIVQSS